MSRRIGIASLVWGVSILLSRVIGVVRESVIGRVLGNGGEADVYWTAFVLPDFLNHLLAGGALSIAFIPIFGAALARGEEDRGWEVFSSVFNFCLGLLLVATAALWVATPWLAPHIGPGYTGEQLALLTRLTRIVLPAQIFHVLGGLLSAVLQAKDKHALPAFASLGYTGCVVLGGVLFGPVLGAEAFAWGVLVGSALGPFGMPLYGCLRDRLGWSPRLNLRDPDFARYFWLTLPIMITFSVVVVDDWLLKRFGSLAGEGVVSRLNYAKTLMKVPMGVFGLAAGAAAFPTLTRLVAEGRRQEAWDTVYTATRVLLLLAVASQVAVTVAGGDMARVIWGTARFSAEQLDEIGLYTGIFCLGLGAWAANTLLSRGFYAQQKTWVPSALGTAVVVVFLPVYAGFGRWWGGVGLAVASSLSITVYAAGLAVLLRRDLAPPGAPGLGGFVLRLAAAAALALGLSGGLSLALRAGLGPEGLGGLTTPTALLRGGLCGGLGGLLTLAFARVLGLDEGVVLTQKMADRLRRRLRRGGGSST